MKKVIFWLFAALLFFVPLILWPYTSEVFEFNKMVLVYMLTTLVVAAWLIRSINEKKLIFRRTILDLPLLIFVGSQLISTILSIDPRTSWLGYYSRFNGGFFSTICYSLLYWAFVSNFEQKYTDKLFNYSLLPSAALISVYAVAEHFGIDKNLWVQDVQMRVFSTLGQPNWLAAWLVAILPVTWAFILNAETKNNKYIYFLLSALFFWTLIFTKSRSGILGLAFAFLVFWGLHFWRNRENIKKNLSPLFLIGSSLLTIILISGTPWTPSVLSLLSRTNKTSPTETTLNTGPALEVGGTESGTIRKIVWKGAFDIWKSYPVFGTGVETFAYSYYQFRPKEHNLVSEWDFIYNKAHNEFINIAANTGTVGLLSYLFLIGTSVLIFIKRPENTGFLAGYIGLAVTNFFGFSVVPTQLQLFLYPAFAVVLTIRDTEKKEPSGKQKETQKILAVVVLSASLYVLSRIASYWYADIRYAQGESYNTTQKPDLAAGYLAEAIKKEPNEGLYHSKLSLSLTNIAIVYDKQKDTEKTKSYTDLAISESDKAASLAPFNLNFKRSRFSVFIILSTIDPKYLAHAISTLEDATKLAPTDAKIFYNLGLTYARTGDTQKALEILKKTIDLKPNYKDPRIAYAILLSERKETKEARSQLEYILNNIDPNDSLTKQTLEGIK